MINFFTALYCEAYLLIQRYRLKKETDWTHFQVFSGESQNMRLILTGAGMIAAAAAVSSVCTKYPPNDYDFLINLGICAGASEQRGLFLCNKITEQTTGKIFYPDILYRHPFHEAQVVTGAKPFKREDIKASQEICLYDMEASAVYQSGSYFFGPHQMYFLKIISDDGNFENITPKQIQDQISAQMENIALFVDCLNKIQEADATSSAGNPEQNLDILCEDLHCSQVMSASVRQLIRYCILSGIDYQAVLNEMYREQKLPCKDKREGKLRFEELGNRLL